MIEAPPGEAFPGRVRARHGTQTAGEVITSSREFRMGDLRSMPGRGRDMAAVRVADLPDLPG
jgi:hypothetical protein